MNRWEQPNSNSVYSLTRSSLALRVTHLRHVRNVGAQLRELARDFVVPASNDTVRSPLGRSEAALPRLDFSLFINL
jgi:hypothetical protein